jgi:hypothetical protein
VFELARIMGTSVRMIGRHYGTLLPGAAASIAARLGAFEAAQERAAQDDAEGVGIASATRDSTVDLDSTRVA